MRVVAFLDLDDTIFQTESKCPPGQELSVAACDALGRPTGYMTNVQLRLTQWLLKTATVIPTTGRSLASFQRVQIKFRDRAILNHGGSVVDPLGNPDPYWQERTARIVAPLQDWLWGWVREAQAFSEQSGLGVRVRMVQDFQTPIYAVAKHPEADLTALAEIESHLEQFLQTSGAPIYRAANGNNLAAIPMGIAKEEAVRYLSELCREEWGEYLSLGIGDSLSDLGFLKNCDWALIPKSSQILSEGFRGF